MMHYALNAHKNIYYIVMKTQVSFTKSFTQICSLSILKSTWFRETTSLGNDKIACYYTYSKPQLSLAGKIHKF